MKASISLLALLFFSIGVPGAAAQEFGKMRPMNQRAAQVIQQRDTFVTQVLTSYGITHDRNALGTVVRINVDGRWLEVTAIEVVPIVEERNRQRQVTAHELYFTTANGVLGLRSELKIH